MSRSGYSEDYEPSNTADWLRCCAYNANTKRHLAGRRGQAFLWELYQALTDLPSRELVPDTMADEHGGVCALGAVAARRGTPFLPDDPPDEEDCGDDWSFAEGIAARLGIKDMMAREVMEANDEDRSIEVPGPAADRYSRLYRAETDHERWARMRRWIVSRLRDIP